MVVVAAHPIHETDWMSSASHAATPRCARANVHISQHCIRLCIRPQPWGSPTCNNIQTPREVSTISSYTFSFLGLALSPELGKGKVGVPFGKFFISLTPKVCNAKCVSVCPVCLVSLALHPSCRGACNIWTAIAILLLSPALQHAGCAMESTC